MVLDNRKGKEDHIMPVIRKPDVTGDYHDSISLHGVTSGECAWCRKPRTHVGMIEIPVPDEAPKSSIEQLMKYHGLPKSRITLEVCPSCLLDLAKDILSAPVA